ncbi:MAG: hypothetical protein DRP78_00675 [Candidatus Omnitrophota bacterium]|nr:MAG: hypothetical protein DRP78_00675 [Candidatus Omnitrophota bacterium]
MFKNIFKIKPGLIVGMDIGNSSVKIVQLRVQHLSGAKELISFNVVPFKSNERSDILQAIRTVAKNIQNSSKLVNISVSGQAVIVRYIQMPKMARQDIEKALQFEVGKYIPFNLNEVNYDFQILDELKSPDKKIQILLVAVKKEIIEERIQLLSDAGLIPNLIDVDSFAIINSFQLIPQENNFPIAILDIGADITSIMALKENMPFFNRDVHIGGKHLTEAIVNGFEISPKVAEEFKIHPKEKYGELVNVVRPVLSRLCVEIQSSFSYCEAQISQPIQKVFLTGGTAKFKGIDKILSSILDADVQIWDPAQILQRDDSLSKEQLEEMGPLLTVSIGLALRG